MRTGGLNWSAGLVSIAAVFLLTAVPGASARTVVDSAGRRIEVPVKIERVFAAGGPASVLLYTLALEKR
jgi:iron complex transport system substrate-binding protein